MLLPPIQVNLQLLITHRWSQLSLSSTVLKSKNSLTGTFDINVTACQSQKEIPLINIAGLLGSVTQ